jgi:hypothetical protein
MTVIDFITLPEQEAWLKELCTHEKTVFFGFATYRFFPCEKEIKQLKFTPQPNKYNDNVFDKSEYQ